MKNLYNFVMKISLTLVLTIFSLSNVSAQIFDTIGDVSSTTSSNEYPVNAYYNYSWSAQIYKSSEFHGNFGNITSISFQVANSVNNFEMINQKIYFAVVSDSIFSNADYITPLSVGATLVFDDTISWNGPGWQELVLSSPYYFGGGDNLLILYENYDGSYSNGYPNFTHTTYSENITKYKREDNSFPASAGTLESKRTNLAFSMLPPPNNDVGVEFIDDPIMNGSNPPNASQSITVTLKNYGLTTNDTVNVYCSIDGGQTYINGTYEGSIPARGSVQYTLPTTVDMSQEHVYNFKVYTSENGDENALNDTLFAPILVCSSMSGSYTVGHNGTDDYNTIFQAINALNSCGVSGPVVINIDTGSYFGQLTIGNIDGASSVNTITFKGNGKKSIIYSTANSTNYAAFELDGCNHIIIDSLTIINNKSPYGFYGILLRNNADSNIIRNCIIDPVYSDYNMVGIIGSSSRTSTQFAFNNHIIIENNTIKTGNSGILFNCDSEEISNDIIIKDNTIIEQESDFIKLEYVNNSIINNNTIIRNNKNPNYNYGISLSSCFGTKTISYNDIQLRGGYGLYINGITSVSTDTTIISNNFISMDIDAGSYINNGFNALSSTQYKFVNNTINLYGNSSNDAVGANIYGENTDNAIIINNVISNYTSGYSIYINLDSNDFTSDYNDYYTAGSFKAFYGSNDILDLATWKTTTGKDAHSISQDPYFTGSDLHLRSAQMDNKGIPVSQVTDDIDLEIRSLTTPDIGADEFTGLANDLSINVYPRPTCGLTSSEEFEVEIINFGSASQMNFEVSYVLDNGSVVTETCVDTLDLMDTTLFVFSTKLDLSQIGIHKISTYTGLTNDEYRENDTMTIDFKSFGVITSLPFFEGFDNGNNYFHLMDRSESEIYIDSINGNNSKYSLVMLGGNKYVGWDYSGNDIAQAIIENSEHESHASLCEIAANEFSNPRMSLQLMKSSYSGSENNNDNWFWVTVNDTNFVKDINGDSAWLGGFETYKQLVFDLSPYSQSTMEIALHGILQKDKSMGKQANIIYIDNVELYELIPNDVGVQGIYSSSFQCGSANDSISVMIKNFGSSSQTNIPVFMTFNYGNTVYNFSDTLKSTLLPDSTVKLFMGVINSTENAMVDVVSYTILSNDTNGFNDTLFNNFYHNVYMPLPYTYDFEDNSDGNWDLNGFYFQDSEYMPGLNSKVLAIDVYDVNYYYAIANDRIGPVSQNSVIKFDLKFQNSTNLQDTLQFYLMENCSNSGVEVFRLDNSTAYSDTLWHHYEVPVGQLASGNVRLAAVLDVSDYGHSIFIAIDNYGIYNNVSFDLGNDTTVCYGETVELNTGLNAEDGYFFSWTGPGVTTADTLSSYTADATGQFNVYISDNTGFVSMDSIYITIGEELIANVNTNRNSICLGDTTLISFEFSGDFPIIYNWNLDEVVTTDTAYYNVYNIIQPDQNAKYKIESAMDKNGCIIYNSDSVEVIVNTPEEIVISGLADSYCASDESVQLTATPYGGSFYGTGMTDSIFNPANAQIGMNEISYSFIDENNCYNADTINTNVFPALMASATATDTTLCYGETTEVGIQLIGRFPMIVDWSENGVAHSDTTYNNLSMVVELTESTNYVVESVLDSNGCTLINPDSIEIVVYDYDTVAIGGLASQYCKNDNSANLIGAPSGGSFVGPGMSGSTFNPATAVNGFNQIIYTYVNTTNNCTNSDTAFTMVYNNPEVSFVSGIQTQYCSNDAAANLYAFPNGGSYTGPGVSGSSFDPSMANAGANEIVYSFTDINSCSDSDTLSINVDTLPSVSINAFADVCSDQGIVSLSGGTPSGGVFSGTAVSSSQSVFYPSVAGVGLSYISYEYTDANGCMNSASESIRVVGIPIVSFTAPNSVCKSDTANIVFIGNVGAAAVYDWSFDNANTIIGVNEGPYSIVWDTAGFKQVSLTVTDSGCTSMPYFNYTNVQDAIAIATLVGSPNICYGDSALIFANGGPGYSYQWLDTSGNITSPTDTLAFYSPTETGEYYVAVTNTSGCTINSNNIGIDINPLITSDFNIVPIACKNDLISVSYVGQSGNFATYNWNFDGGTIATGSGVGPYNIIWSTDSLKTVSLEVTENGCSSDITEHYINIITTPAQITAMGSTSFCEGGNVSLSANAGNYSYKWFKDGITSTNTQAMYVVSEAGNYTVEITDNATNCSNISDTVEVTVNSNDFNIAFTATPTSFTIPPFNTNFTNETPNANDYYWNWSFGDGNTSTFVSPSHQYMFDGTYSVGLVAQNVTTGCFDTLSKIDYITCTGGSPNPCSLDATIASDGRHQVCPSDSVKLWSVEHTAGVSYQWIRDGVLLTGASDSVYYASQTGLYQLMLTDAACNTFSNPYSLTQYITVIPSIFNNGTIQPCSDDSMELYVSTTFNSYQWSNGSNDQSIYVKTSGSFIVTVTDNNGCNSSSDPYVVNASLLEVPDICIVGIDELTNHNRVVWERQNSAMIDSFKIYRESTVAGVYDLIGSQSFSTQSVFEDVSSNPAQMAYRYRITAVDTCGMETAPSPIHKTLHLTINAGLGGVWNLIWTNYEGFNFGSYRIYRSTDSTNMQLLTQIQSTLTSYTDLNPPTGDVFYQIEIVSPHPCYPDSIYSKANTNYNTSRSNTANTNMAPNTGFVRSVNNDMSMQVYPNPNKGNFELQVQAERLKANQTYSIEVYSVMGKMVYQEEVKATMNLRKAMHFETISKGVYFIRLRTENTVLNTRFVVE